MSYPCQNFKVRVAPRNCSLDSVKAVVEDTYKTIGASYDIAAWSITVDTRTPGIDDFIEYFVSVQNNTSNVCLHWLINTLAEACTKAKLDVNLEVVVMFGTLGYSDSFVYGHAERYGKE